MHNFYFTFGSHYTNGGTLMRNYWVRVIAPDWQSARETFIHEFTSIRMANRYSWSHQYEDHNFNREFYPAGEYACFTAKLGEEKEEEGTHAI